jgi:hypothetical protein
LEAKKGKVAAEGFQKSLEFFLDQEANRIKAAD